jgi:hypothetical protein
VLVENVGGEPEGVRRFRDKALPVVKTAAGYGQAGAEIPSEHSLRGDEDERGRTHCGVTTPYILIQGREGKSPETYGDYDLSHSETWVG